MYPEQQRNLLMTDVLFRQKTTVARFESFNDLIDAMSYFASDPIIRETIIDSVDPMWEDLSLRFPSHADAHVRQMLERLEVRHVLRTD